MKKLFTLLALTIGFSMNAQLTAVTEGDNTGQRLTTSNSSNHGDIGDKAVDLSISGSSSSTNGATGEYSISMGRSTIASGINSTSMGIYTTASGNYSTAMGRGTLASGTYSTAIGRSAEATGDYSTAMGYYTTASTQSSTAMGYYTTASGDVSTAMGSYTTASDYASVVIGQYNSSGSSVTNSASLFSTSNTAFVIGNGTASDAKSDAFKVMFNGDTYVYNTLDVTGDTSVSTFDSSGATSLATGGGVVNVASTGVMTTVKGTLNVDEAVTLDTTLDVTGDATIGNDLTVSGDVVVSSDARLKSNIVSLGSTLSRLLLIDGKSYEMKGKQKIGVLAQDIKEVFPELVSEDANEMLAVNYQGLVPVLINALKEQDGKIKEQQSEIEILKQQQAEIDELKEMVNQLISSK